MIEVPVLGEVQRYEFDNWLKSKPIAVDVFDGEKVEFILEDYAEDEVKEGFHQAIANFLAIDESVLKQAQNHIYQYYKDVADYMTPDEEGYLEIANPQDTWDHIELGATPIVSRRAYGDKEVYISLECDCDWETEHGLQIVFKQGLVVNKVGPYDGHLTNSDAYADDKLENVIYY